MEYLGAFGIIAVVAVLMGLLGAWVASQKGRPAAEGLLLGAVFGPLGVIIEALLPGNSGKAERLSASAQDIDAPLAQGPPKRWERPLGGEVKESGLERYPPKGERYPPKG